MFKKRLISSIVLVIVALVTILQGGYLLAAVLLFLSLTAYRFNPLLPESTTMVLTGLFTRRISSGTGMENLLYLVPIL